MVRPLVHNRPTPLVWSVSQTGTFHLSYIDTIREMSTDSSVRVLLASVPSQVYNKWLQLRRSTEHTDGGGLFTDGLTSRRQLWQLATAAFAVTRVAVSLPTNSLPRLVQTVENRLLLGQQSCRQVVDESLVLLLDMRTWTGKYLLRNAVWYFEWLSQLSLSVHNYITAAVCQAIRQKN